MNDRIEHIVRYLTRNQILLYLFYAGITLLIYRGTYQAGMVFDFNGWAGVYEKHDFIDAFNSFGYPGLHQLEQITFYSLYKLFGFNGIYWYITFALLHALTALISLNLIIKLSTFIRLNESVGLLTALFASFLFLLSPYAADVVVPKVTVHYYLSAIFIYSCLIFYLKFLETSKAKDLVLSCLFFALGLFSLELSYLIPFAILFLLIFRVVVLKTGTISVKYVIPFFLVFAGFLLLHKWVVGSVVGHYGSEVHTRFDITELIDHFFYYFNSYALFGDFWDFKYKLFQQKMVLKYSWVLLLVSFVFIGIAWIKDWFKIKIVQATLLYFILFAIGLLPILNLFCVRLQEIENDRYSYVASIFFYALLVQGIFLIKSNFKYLILSFYLLLTCYFLSSNVKAFEEMGIVSSGLITDFRWEDKSKIIILVQPENYNGARAFTTLVEEGSEFAESLFLERGIDIRDRVSLVYEMNINSANDSVKVQIINDRQIHVEIGWWGSWFWKYHNGALPFTTSEYHTEMKDNLGFDLFLNEALKDDEVIIYAHGNRWKEIQF